VHTATWRGACAHPTVVIVLIVSVAVVVIVAFVVAVVVVVVVVVVTSSLGRWLPVLACSRSPTQADVIVMSGGNTLFACDLLARLGVNPLLHRAMRRGCVLCGGSAGAICWFDAGHSDSMDPAYYLGARNASPRSRSRSRARMHACAHQRARASKPHTRCERSRGTVFCLPPADALTHSATAVTSHGTSSFPWVCVCIRSSCSHRRSGAHIPG
jgi:hypothetical protein